MKGRLRRAADFVAERYFSADARTLGLFRIVFGLHLIANLYDRTQGPDAIAFYTNDGVLPNHFALFAPLGDRIWSLLFPFSTPAEVQVAFAVILAVYVAYTAGYCTKVMQILVVVCQLSLANRNLILQNGGIVVTNLVTIWTAFLPLGARFSIDHLRRSLAERHEREPAELADRAAMVRSKTRYARLAFFGIVVNFAWIYFFNFAHKTGGTWHDGSAVHWVLWQNRIATVWAAWLRMHEPAWLSPVTTWGTLALEAALPLWLLSPIGQTWTRRVAIFSIWSLHASISLMLTLGPFSYSMMSFSLLLIGPADWAAVKRFWTAKNRLLVFYDPENGQHQHWARLLARLDSRLALEFIDCRAFDRVPPDLAGEATRKRFFVVDQRQNGVTSGAFGAARVIRALPLGVLYAWPLRLPFLRDAIDRAIYDPAPQSPAQAPDEFIEAPATRFLRAILRCAGELSAAVFLSTVLVQAATDNWAIPQKYRVKNRPEFMRQIVEYLRTPQGWSMFSPDAPKDDGTIVIDAVLSDGRHIDPRKQKPPDFEPALHGPWFDDQQWCDWDLRVHFDGNRHLQPNFRDYIARLDKLSGWKQQASIRYFDVYWVSNAAPAPGSTKPYNTQKQFLFAGGVRP